MVRKASDADLLREEKEDPTLMKKIMEVASKLSRGILDQVISFLGYISTDRGLLGTATIALGHMGLTYFVVRVAANYTGALAASVLLLHVLVMSVALLMFDIKKAKWDEVVETMKKRTGASYKEIREVLIAVLEAEGRGKNALYSRNFRNRVYRAAGSILRGDID